uniref:RES domain-containing protein n=1 Tax=Macrostomum lignano TaxID=282301 RepID=A0A1I8F7A4_9PLAT
MMSDAGERMLAAQEASQRPDFNGRVYSHASVYAYRSDGSGEPQVYQAVSESRAGGPGGVRETRKALKDSRSREERIALGTTSAAAGTRLRGGETPARASSRRTITMMALTRARASSFDREWTGVLLASPLKARRRRRPPRRSLSAPSGHHGRQALKVSRLCGIC